MNTSKKTKLIASFAFLLVASFGCSSKETTINSGNGGSPGAGGSLGAGNSGSPGAAPQAGSGGVSAGAGGGAGSAGQPSAGAAGYDTSLCSEACARAVDCKGADVAACEAQCVKELTGEGYLIPELANDFFLGLRDIEPGKECGYKFGIYWDKWAPSAEPKGKYDTLLEQNVLMECFDAFRKCNGEVTPADNKYDCIVQYYRYNKDRREKIKPCFAEKCPNKEYCAEPYQLLDQPWLDLPKPTK